MNEQETKQILCSILTILREQTIYTQRLHGWVIAASETIEQYPDLTAKLKAHPFFYQGPRPDVHITAGLIENIDGLIRQLREQR